MTTYDDKYGENYDENYDDPYGQPYDAHDPRTPASHLSFRFLFYFFVTEHIRCDAGSRGYAGRRCATASLTVFLYLYYSR